MRLKAAGYQLIQGPGPLVQVFRINSTRGPFKNEKFRQAFNYLMDREGILRVGYAGLGEVGRAALGPGEPGLRRFLQHRATPSTWRRRKALLAASGLSAAEMSDWKLLVNGGDQPSVAISQIVQSTLAQGRHQHRSST